MNGLDIFSLFVLLVIILLFVGLLLLLGWLPGDIAKKRHSPWAEAIVVAGWIGILFLPLWPFALVAAFWRPRSGEGAQIAISQAEATELAASITPLIERIKELEAGMSRLALKSKAQGAGE